MIPSLLLLLLAPPPAAAPPAATAPAAPPEALLDVDWGDGLETGRIAKIDVKGPAKITKLRGTLAKEDVIALAASDDGRAWIVLGPVDIERKAKPVPLVLDAVLDDGREVHFAKPAPVIEAPYPESHITVARKFVTPSRAQRRRATREARVMTAAMAHPSSERLWRGSFARPVPGPQTSAFGTKRTYASDHNKKKYNRHYGWDLDGSIGDPISASNRGRVVLAANRFYSGGTVILDHGEGLYTLYFHMSRIDVKEGDVVEKGQGLGAVGASGQVTGPHLHFAVKFDGLYQDARYLVDLDLSHDAVDPPLTAAASAGAPSP